MTSTHKSETLFLNLSVIIRLLLDALSSIVGQDVDTNFNKGAEEMQVLTAFHCQSFKLK